MTVDIVELIEKNPISTLTDTYNHRLLEKIKHHFKEAEQRLFVSSFYCFIKYDKVNDFVVDLDNIWKWLGFARKQNATNVLDKFFKEGCDYKTTATTETVTKKWGGSNSKKIMMSVNTFKSFCLKANTNKSTEIHNYYIKLEDMLHEVLVEEAVEFKNQIGSLKEEAKEAKKATEKATLLQFPLNTECVYMGVFSHDNKTYIKYGQTNNLNQRVRDHRKTFGDFILSGAFRVQNKVEIENLITHDSRVKPHLTSLVVGDKTYKEIIVSGEENLLVENLHCIIVNIIETRKFNIENFHKVVKENDTLNSENQKLREEIRKHLTEIEDLKREQHSLITKVKITKYEKQEVEDRVEINKVLETKEDGENNDIKKWIYDHCLVGDDKQVSRKKIEGWYRITTGNKIDLFIKYLKKIFAENNHLPDPNKPGSTCSSFIGVELKEIDNSIYDIKDEKSDDAEYREFIENNCEFKPEAKVNMELLTQRFITLQGKKADKKTIKKEFKTYLKRRKDIFHSNVTTCDENGKEVNGLGFYGMNLKGCIAKQSKTSSTAKAVEKICQKTGKVLGEWSCLREAADMNSMSSHVAMSRAVRDKKLFEEGDMVVFYRSKV